MELTLDQALQKGVEAHKAGQVQEADRYYTAILKANPEHPDANHNMGVLAVGVGKVEESLPFFKAAIDTNANIEQFWLSYIDAFIKLERIAEAKVVLDQAKSKGVNGKGFDKLEKQIASPKLEITGEAQEPPKDQLQPVINLYTQGKLEETLNEASKLLNNFPNSVTLYNIVGAANQGLGNLAEAITAYKKAISIKPDYVDAYNNMGVVLKDQDKLDDAIQAYQKAISIKPDFAEAYNNMGVALKNNGKLDDAIEAYKKALSIRPKYVEACNNVGIALQEQGKLDEAINAYNTTLSLKPDQPNAYNNMGNALQGQGKLDEAIEAYKEALTIKPEYAEAYNNMGIALKGQGNLDEAIEAYEKALSLKPDYPDAFNNMGNALKEQGKLDEAIEAYKEALTIKPDFSETFNNMGIALKEQGNLDEAIEAYEKALSLKPDYAEAWVNGADALEKWNKLSDLRIWLDKAFASFEKVPAGLIFMKSKLLWRNKKYNETLSLMSDVQFENIIDNQKQEYLHLRAKCFELAHDFDNAYKCFAESNLLAKTSKDYLRLNPQNYFQFYTDKLIKLKSKQLIKARISRKIKSELNPVFLIGFPRSGTTLLDTILRSHSKINIIEEKPMVQAAKIYLNKIGYDDFSGQLIPQELNLEAQKVYTRECQKHIKKIEMNVIYIDKFPLNLLETPMIHQLYPNAKFILALRHPMDTILSCWMQNFKLNSAMANMVDLDRIVDFYCIAMETFKICRTNYNLNVHQIRYEDLINNFKKETEAVVKFLNLKWDPKMEKYQDTALKRGRIRTPSYSQVVQPIYKDAQYRWLNYRKYLEQYLPQVNPWISEFRYD